MDLSSFRILAEFPGLDRSGRFAKVQLIFLTRLPGSASLGLGWPNADYASFTDPSFWPVANRYPTHLIRHNWELNHMMDDIYPSRSSLNSPNFSIIDNFLNNGPNFKGFFDNSTGRQVVTLGFP